MQTEIDVLVIDDCDTDARDTMLGIRHARAHASIARLRDGEIATEFVFRLGLFEERPDTLPRLLFLDLDLPQGGLEFLKRLRRMPETREIPVLVFTRNRNPIVMDDAYEAGASAYVVKPEDRGEYLSEVARLVNRWLPQDGDGRSDAGTD